MTPASRIHQGGAPPRTAILARRIFDGFAMRGEGAVIIEGQRIIGVDHARDDSSAMGPVTLPDDWLLAPGFVDWQVNGGGGVLLNDAPNAHGVQAILEAHRAHGTTSLAPTLITDAPHKMQALLAADLWRMDGVAALHLEGPFIDAGKRGVHPLQHVRTMTARDLELLLAAAQRGPTIVTLAPEHAPQGAVAALSRAGAIVSLGHTNAPASRCCAAFAEGARATTHLFNAMSQLSAREPGLVGAALAEPQARMGVIADGAHVHATNLRLALALAGPRRLTLVSDAMPSVGARTPRFNLFGEEITLRERRLVAASGALAGAHLTMLEAVRRFRKMTNAPLEDALAMATSTPAQLLGQAGSIGALRAGAFADLIALDANFRLKAVFFRGERMATCAPSLEEERE